MLNQMSFKKALIIKSKLKHEEFNLSTIEPSEFWKMFESSKTSRFSVLLNDSILDSNDTSSWHKLLFILVIKAVYPYRIVFFYVDSDLVQDCIDIRTKLLEDEIKASESPDKEEDRAIKRFVDKCRLLPIYAQISMQD